MWNIPNRKTIRGQKTRHNSTLQDQYKNKRKYCPPTKGNMMDEIPLIELLCLSGKNYDAQQHS